MAVSLYFGMTESGKSWRAKEDIRPKKRAIIFDYVGRCFNDLGGVVCNDFSESSLLRLVDKYSRQNEFKIIMRPNRIIKDIEAFDLSCHLAVSFGRLLSRADERLAFVIDEADKICTATTRSRALQLVVTKGRHDNVDTYAIAQAPQRVHTDLRVNCSRLVCFQVSDASALTAINRIGVGKSELGLVSTLGIGTYSYFEWTSNGEWFVKDRNGKITRKFNHAKHNQNRGL